MIWKSPPPFPDVRWVTGEMHPCGGGSRGWESPLSPGNCAESGEGKVAPAVPLVVLLSHKNVWVAKTISDVFQYHNHQIQQAAVKEIQDTGGNGCGVSIDTDKSGFTWITDCKTWAHYKTRVQPRMRTAQCNYKDYITNQTQYRITIYYNGVLLLFDDVSFWM